MTPRLRALLFTGICRISIGLLYVCLSGCGSSGGSSDCPHVDSNASETDKQDACRCLCDSEPDFRSFVHDELGQCVTTFNDDCADVDSPCFCDILDSVTLTCSWSKVVLGAMPVR